MGGSRAAARTRFEESVRLVAAVGERWMRALVLDGLASLLDAGGETARDGRFDESVSTICQRQQLQGTALQPLVARPAAW